MERWGEADRHFEDALAHNARIGMWPALARTQLAYGAALLRRGHPDERPRAAELLAAARATASDLGMSRLLQRLDALHPGAAPAGSPPYAHGRTAREAELLR
jgi:hypothetical protein